MSQSSFGRPVSAPGGEFMFGRYLVRRLLGAGGMASVFLAEDTLSRRAVALKVMSQELEADPEYRARFVREARVLLGLRHANVVQVIDAGEEGGRPYFCMEYLEGEDLEQRIRRTGPVHWREALGFMRQALLGLAAAWQAGVVHRDVKPENLFITQGVLKVMDFGVARPLQADGFQTQMGMVVGTPAYIAPEQAMGRKVDFRADIYALGATFWHVMAGRTPYGEGSPTALCNCHVYEPFPSLGGVVPGAPRGVVDLLARLAEKDPQNRGDQQSTLMALDALLALPVTDAPRAVAGPRMTVESGRMVGTVVAVPEGELIIGRMPGCGLVLDDARASRRHAVVARRGAFLEVRDLGSRNGVLLNGHPIQTAPLAEGDRVTVGDTVMRVEGLSGTYTDPIVTSGKGYSPQELGLPQPAAAAQAGAAPPVVVARAQFGNPGSHAGAAVGAVGQKEVLHSRAEQAGFDRLADGRMAATTPLARHLQILYRLGKAVAGALDMPDLGGRVMELVWEAVPFDRGFVLLEGTTVGADGRREWGVVASRDAHGVAVNGRPSATVIKKVRDEGVSLQTADATTDQRLDMSASVMNLRIRGVLCAPMWAGDQMIGAVYVDRGTQRPFVAEELITLEAISDFAGTAFQQHLQAARARAANRMVEDLSRFVAPEVKQELDRRSETDVAALLSHRELDAAVLFCDIQGFTPLCERLRPNEVAALLTQYFNVLTDAVMAEKGSLNKFIGDACMGLFGVPLPLDNNSLRAVQAGMGIIRRMADLQQTLPPDRRFKVRVGVNTGVLVAGAFGSERRMEYTVLGDVVNTAARLESNAAPMTIMLGERTYQDVKNQVACTAKGSITVKGKAQPLTVYEVAVPGITGN